jgi:predicted ArsR family transcriptional regulator
VSLEIDSGWRLVLISPIRVHIVLYLNTMGPATVAEMAASSGTSERSLRDHLEALVELDLVQEHDTECDGLTKGRPARRFFLEAAVEESAGALLKVLSRPFSPSSRQSARRTADP